MECNLKTHASVYIKNYLYTKKLPYFNWLNFWTAAVEDFWTANSGSIVAAASSSAESPDQSSNTTPVAKLNTFDYQGKIIVEILSLLLLLKAAKSLKIFCFCHICKWLNQIIVTLKFKIWVPFSIFSCLIFSYFPTWKRCFVFPKSSYFETGKNISKGQNLKFIFWVFWDFAAFIVLILLSLVLSSLSIQWRKV